MHFMSQPRYNPRTQRDDWYYRIKESFRDLTGRVRSRVMLNVGFIEEPHRPEDIRDIGKCLTYLHEHQGQEELFGNHCHATTSTCSERNGSSGMKWSTTAA